jgi:hypothetical protein
MNVFLIATLHQGEKRRRTWGWYSDFAYVEKVVLENQGDIFERGYYDLAVIEEMPEGALAVAENTWWYRATYSKDKIKVEKIQQPAEFAGNFNFTVG